VCFYSNDNDARTFDDYNNFSFDGVGGAYACANARHLGRQLQYYGPGKRVQAPSVQTPSVQTPSVQAGTAGTLACTEIQITAWDGQARAYSQIENRKPADWKHTVVSLRSTDGANVSEFADHAWRWPRRRRRPMRRTASRMIRWIRCRPTAATSAAPATR